MARMHHGEVISLDKINETLNEMGLRNTNLLIVATPPVLTGLTGFGFMFQDLQIEPDSRLPISDATIDSLIKLGETMDDPGAPEFDSKIPSAYTYFGQFLNHEITLETESDKVVDISEGYFAPMSRNDLSQALKNGRTPTLDLDSVYVTATNGWPIPKQCNSLLLGPCAETGNRPQGKGIMNDLRRQPRSDNPDADRKAIIGDARNDENLIISQLHVAFVQAHNTLVAGGRNFAAAKKTLIQHFQWLVIHDFLRRIADPGIVDRVLERGNQFYKPIACDPYMPLEFSAGVFRFGHSMIRMIYNYNEFHTEVGLLDLFDATSFRGDKFKEFEQIPDHWIIDWKRFVDGPNFARRIDTRLVEPLRSLRDSHGSALTGRKASLAVRNLLRGYLLRLPTGQRVARAIGVDVLSPEDLKRTAANPDQAEVLQLSGFLEQTPLWYYILAEASRGETLGPVGSTIVAEVLIGAARISKHSILNEENWYPTLGKEQGVFRLSDLFNLGNGWA